MSEGVLCPALRFQVSDENGAPADGALVYTYTAGSSTPLATYSDASLSTVNDNPVECDSFGQAVIFLQPLAYKFVVKTSAGVILYSQDNVLGWNAGVASARTTVCGRITGVTGSAVADATGATTLYYTPYKGNQIGLYDGTSWSAVTFSETSLLLGTDTASKNYDLFGYSSSGTLTLERVVWTSDTARATDLTTQDGVLVKSGDATRRYLGTYRTTSAPGSVTDSVLIRGIWNYYNRVRRVLRAVEATTSWVYTTATLRQANGSTANQVAVVVGVADTTLELTLLGGASNTIAANVSVVIGEDSTTAPATGCIMTLISAVGSAVVVSPTARLVRTPAIGYHFYTWLEFTEVTGFTTWYGTVAATVQQSGLLGSIES